MTATTVNTTGFDQLRAQVQAEVLTRLPEHIERLRWSREQIEKAQREALRALLAHATENSPFHRQRLGHIDPSHFDLPDLTSLPVMTKAEMMESLDNVFSDRRLNRALVEQALAATATEPVPIRGGLAILGRRRLRRPHLGLPARQTHLGPRPSGSSGRLGAEGADDRQRLRVPSPGV